MEVFVIVKIVGKGRNGFIVCDYNLFVGEGFNWVFVDCDFSVYGEVVVIRNVGKNLRIFDL